MLGPIKGTLGYEYQVVNLNHGRLVPSSEAVWGLRPSGRKAALAAKGKGAVLRYQTQRKEWDTKAVDLAKQRGGKLYPSAPFVRTWHNTDVRPEGAKPAVDIYSGADREAAKP